MRVKSVVHVFLTQPVCRTRCLIARDSNVIYMFYWTRALQNKTHKRLNTTFVVVNCTLQFKFSEQISHSGELQMPKLKSHLVRTQSLSVLPLKPGVGQYIAIHATLTARDFFLAYVYPSGLFTCIFSKTSPICFFPVLAVANTWFLCRPAE